MELILLSSIPVLILALFGNRLPSHLKGILKIACFPFIILIAFYSLILGGAIVVAVLLYLSVRKVRLQKEYDKQQRVVRNISIDG